ncbi:hypothetical protein GS504_01170 [Rhodococcus hoagii]|nr:hypothetical protein [Prescottella equi]
MTTLAARGIAAAADSTCPRVAALADHGYTATFAATTLFGLTVRKGSAFALAEGRRFESSLTSDGAEGLRNLYSHALNPESCEVPVAVVMDLDGDARDDEHAGNVAAAAALVVDAVRSGTGPDLVLQAPIELRIGDRTELLRPDVLAREGSTWRVGEIKAYLDRDGYTDGARIKSAVLQTAASIVALRDLLTSNGFSEEEAETAVPAVADIILQRPDFENPSKRTLSAVAEVAQVASLVARLRSPGSAGSTRWTQRDVLLTDHVYSSTCERVCPLAPACRSQAREQDPSREFFGGPGIRDVETANVSIGRAHQLAVGHSPMSAEKDLAAALRTGYLAAIAARGATHTNQQLSENRDMRGRRMGETL